MQNNKDKIKIRMKSVLNKEIVKYFKEIKKLFLINKEIKSALNVKQ